MGRRQGPRSQNPAPRELGDGGVPAQLPPLSAQCQGKAFPSIHLWTRFLSALGGLLYASAIVAHDRRPEYLLRATPWFLTSLGRAALDLSVSTLGLGGFTAGVSPPPTPTPAVPPLPCDLMQRSPRGAREEV